MAQQKIAGASVQQAHHGGGGERPLGALNVVDDGGAGPATARHGCGGGSANSQARAQWHQQACTVTLTALALAAGICRVRLHRAVVCAGRGVAAECLCLCLCLCLGSAHGLMCGITDAVRACAARHQSQPDKQQMKNQCSHAGDFISVIRADMGMKVNIPKSTPKRCPGFMLLPTKFKPIFNCRLFVPPHHTRVNLYAAFLIATYPRKICHRARFDA